MKETQFIKNNKEKWKRFEQLSANSSSNPEELTNLYVDITDDLGYAQTYYQHRTVRVYLNQLAQKVFWGVNKFKKDTFKNLFAETIVSIPIAIYQSRRALLTALIAFLVYAAIGVFSTIIEPDFPRWVMGDGYVDMTIQNIAEGNPLKVYEDDDQLSMFMRITTNNIGVALLTFVAGFLLSIGTHFLLFQNGVMLGAFQYYFHTKGLLLTSFLGIWIHGAFEISAIVLAGGAGLTIGNSWLFPGNQSRGQALKNGASRGIKIMIVLIPFIVAAGFLESYVTHHYDDLPDWTKWAIILFSFALMILTFVVWPFVVAQKYPEKVHEAEPLASNRSKPIEMEIARSLGQLIRDSLYLFGQQFSTLFPPLFLRVFVPIFLIVLTRAYFHSEDLEVTYFYDWYSHIGIMSGSSFNGGIDVVLWLSWVLGIGLSVYFTLKHISTLNSSLFSRWLSGLHSSPDSYRDYTLLPMVIGTTLFSLHSSLLILHFSLSIILLTGIYYLFPWYVFLFFTPFLPFFLMVPIVVFHEKIGLFKAIKRSFQLNSVVYWKSLILLAVLMVVIGILMQPIAGFFSIIFDNFMSEPAMPDVLDSLCKLIITGVDYAGLDGLFWSNIFREFIYLIFTCGVIILLAIAWNLVYQDAIEERESRTLRQQFDLFGNRNRHQETEHAL
jgi:uncharacterized membrane protein SpoIIM required for sporulation